MAKASTNGVDEMLEMLYEMIDDAKAIPFSTDCRLDRNGALDLLDSIRSKFPTELGEAAKVIQQRDQILEDAHKDADRIVEQAQAQARRIVDENELVRQARAAAEEAIRTAKSRATEILTKANDDARAVTDEADMRAEGLKRAANEYCADALRRTEDAVSEAYNEIKQSHDHFRSLIATSGSTGSRRPAAYDAEKDI